MKRFLIIFSILFFGITIFFLFASPFNKNTEPAKSSTIDQTTIKVRDPRQISAEDAKIKLDEQPSHIILDVRTEEEFTEEHIQGAILIPHDQLGLRAESELPDKSALIVLYCRTGIRSAEALKELTTLGYTNIYDIGSISDWPYDKVLQQNQDT